jgi:hypothetical protein
MACGITFNSPIRRIQTGPTQTDTINVPAPASGTADLTITFAAGELNLAPGAGGALVDGTATYNVQDLKPEVHTNGNTINVQTGNLEVRGIPSFSGNVKNTWDVKLGDQPVNLTIKAGAYKGVYELGGLSLQSLDVGDGAADVQMKFSEPNKVEMGTLRYETGASNVDMSGLGNANFSSMVFRSGAGNYTLDFSGDLQRDASVDVESGISQVTIIVPQNVQATITFEGGLSNVNPQGGWQKSGNTYTHAGSGPALTFRVNMGAGSLELRSQ